MSQRVKSTTVPWSSFVEGDDGCIGLNDKLLCFWQTTQEIMQHMQGNTPYLFLIPSTTFLTFQISPEDFCSNLRKFSVADWQETNRSFSDISKKSPTHLRVKRTHPSPLYSWDKRQKTLNMCTYVRYKVVAAYVCVCMYAETSVIRLRYFKRSWPPIFFQRQPKYWVTSLAFLKNGPFKYTLLKVPFGQLLQKFLFPHLFH